MRALFILDTKIFLLDFAWLMPYSHLYINYVGCCSGDLGSTVLGITYSATLKNNPAFLLCPAPKRGDGRDHSAAACA